MAEETFTIGDKEVTVRETDDGFEAVEANTESGTPSRFEADTGFSAGSSLNFGSIDTIEEQPGTTVRVQADDSSRDVMSGIITEAIESGWHPIKVEFEYGYVDFDHVDPDDSGTEDEDVEGNLYLRGVSDDGDFGFEVPIDGEYAIDYDSGLSEIDPHMAAWDTSEDVSSLNSDGGAGELASEHGYDGHAVLSEFTTVER